MPKLKLPPYIQLTDVSTVHHWIHSDFGVRGEIGQGVIDAVARALENNDSTVEEPINPSIDSIVEISRKMLYSIVKSKYVEPDVTTDGTITRTGMINSLKTEFPSTNTSIISDYINAQKIKPGLRKDGWDAYYIHKKAAFRKNFEQYAQLEKAKNAFSTKHQQPNKNAFSEFGGGAKAKKTAANKKPPTGKVHTGPRGGKYVIRKGKKVYL